MNVDLSGKVAVVTGSGAGIGRATALTFAANGAKVVVNGRSDSAQAVAEEIRNSGGEAIFERANIDVYAEMKSMVDRTVQRWGRIDILMVSGGKMYTPKPFLQIDPETIPDYFSRAINRVQCARAVAEPMANQGFGKIIFMGTDAGRWPTPSESINGASGAAIVFFTRCLAMELARVGVRVYTISTTLTKDTPGYQAFQDMGQSSGEVIARVFRKIEEKVPFGLNKPQDVANLALFLAGDESNQISGATISINGGISFPG